MYLAEKCGIMKMPLATCDIHTVSQPCVKCIYILGFLIACLFCFKNFVFFCNRFRRKKTYPLQSRLELFENTCVSYTSYKVPTSALKAEDQQSTMRRDIWNKLYLIRTARCLKYDKYHSCTWETMQTKPLQTLAYFLLSSNAVLLLKSKRQVIKELQHLRWILRSSDNLWLCPSSCKPTHKYSILQQESFFVVVIISVFQPGS